MFIRKFKYRPEIDGLRAIAVLPVVFYHVGLGIQGGFVGVDVFFVISGYLITSLIIKELSEGRFSFADFWERRARRIIPALATVTTITLLAGWFFLLPLQYADLGESVSYMALFIANIYFYLGTGYFAGASEEKPLLHTWSLAVEEQFYLLLPLVLFMVYRIRFFRTRGHLMLLFGIGISLSFCLGIYTLPQHPAATFYLLPTRAWELLCGSLIAVLPASLLSSNRFLREMLSWVGLMAILIPCWLYNKDTPFPGMAAVPPCLGAALVIFATNQNQGRTSSDGVKTHLFITSILSSRPFVFIGLISYSLYLWHWPLVAFSNYWALDPLPTSFRLGILVLSVLLAVLSWRFVETPFREKKICHSRTGIFIFSTSTAGLLFGFGWLISSSGGFHSRLPESLKSAFARNPQDDLKFVSNLGEQDVLSNKLPMIGVGDRSDEIEILVWGDSHAMAAMPAFDDYCKRHGIAGRYATYSSRAPVLNWYGNDSMNSKKFNEAILQYVKKNKVPNVFMVGCWIKHSEKSDLEEFQRAIESTIKEFMAVGCQPWVVLMVPNHKYEVPKALALADFLGKTEAAYCSKPDSWNGIAGIGINFVRIMENAGARVIDPRPEFLCPETGYYRMTLGGKSLYRDRHHLSMEGAQAILSPLFERSLRLQIRGNDQR